MIALGLPPVRRAATLLASLLAALFLANGALAHAVAEGDKGYFQEISGVHLLPFVYLGAKHMVTGYGHILFLPGVVFFLYRLNHVALYVRLFALGHSTTMLLGVHFNVGINSYLIDAIIGLSVVCKALDNMGAYQRWFGFQPDTKAATLVFGLFHGFGHSTRIIEYEISPAPSCPAPRSSSPGWAKSRSSSPSRRRWTARRTGSRRRPRRPTAGRASPGYSPPCWSPALLVSLAAAQPAPTAKTDEVVFTLKPNRGIEYKMTMQRGGVVQFSWRTDGGKETSCRKGSQVTSDTGTLTAAYDGSHGWFWRNRGSADVTITLRTKGAYTEIKRMN